MTLEAELAEHAPFLRALARRLVADAATADDLVQDACVAALARGSRQPVRPLPWLVAVLRHHAARWFRGDRRRRAREQVVAGDLRSLDAAAVAGKLEVARRLLQHVEALDARSREVVYLRFYQDHQPRQIAAKLALPLATVKTRLARALARLRERLDADDPQGQRQWLPALCVIGGVRPGSAPSVFPARRTLSAAVASLTAVALIGALLIDPPAPAVQPPLAAALPTSAAGSATNAHTQRQSTAVPLPSLVRGLVEDANIDAVPGTGTPAPGVVVRYRLRESPALAGSPGETPVRTIPSPLVTSTAARRTSEFETTTDADSRFLIEMPDLATLESAEVVGNGLVGSARWSAGRQVGSLPGDLVLTRRLRGALTGAVVDLAGVGVPCAVVRLAHWADKERVAVEAVTDGGGRFAFARVEPDSWLEAELDGHVQVAAMQPREGPRGGWEHARILLAPSGTLAVEVVDSAGRPAAHANGVAVAAAPAELGLAGQFRFDGLFRRTVKLVGGSARLIVPAGLQLQLWSGDTFDADRNGRAVRNQPEEPVAPPIVVEPGAVRALRLVLGTDLEVRGVVVDPDGKPVANAEVQLLRILDARLEAAALVRTDARGGFVQSVSGADGRQPLLVVARGGGAADGLRAERRLHVGGTDPVVVEMRLAAAQGVVGRVRDAEGRPIAARIRCRLAIPEVAGLVECAAEWRTDADGAFRVSGHADAVHQLEIASEGWCAVTVGGVRAGDAPIDVVLDRPKPATIRLRTSAPTPLADLEVFVCYASAGTESGQALPPPGASPWSHAVPPFWPNAPVRTWPVDGPWRCEVHRRRASSDGVLALPLDTGRAWIFVSGCDLDGAQMSLLSSGPVAIPPGDTALSVELAPTVTCRGRIQLGKNAERFPACVAIADEAGQLLAVSVLGLEGAWSRIVATSTHGCFALGAIPRGTWELQVGTREELQRGEAKVRKRMAFLHDLTEEIVVQL